MADRLLVDLNVDGLVTISIWPQGGLPETVSQAPLVWPLDDEALEDLRWYLEDYLRAPFGVWEDRGPQIHARLAGWGEVVFASVFGSGPAQDAYQRARDQELELVFRSASPGLLGLPWELMRDPVGPVALGLSGMSRVLPVADLAHTAAIPGERLRVLMVISRPAGTEDIGYQMIARPLMERLDAVRGEVDLMVLRPPTLNALRDTLADAAEAGEPFDVVHFDGHGALRADTGLLVLEGRNGGSHPVSASRLAAVLNGAGVPVVVLNACQSGAVGRDVEAAIATRLVLDGCAAVVAMSYSVYAVAAAEFMAIFYERLFAGDTVTQAVTAGRKRLFEKDWRPSPKGDLPLADWLVPVHYLRREVSFPQAQTRRPAAQPSLEALLDDFRAPATGCDDGSGSLDPVGTFVGRDDLLYHLDAAARLQKVVVLQGPGGTGKTELAKAFGRWWRDTGGVDRPEWVSWHSFEPGVASFGLDGVITDTGLAVFGPEFARLDPGERRHVVEELLEQRRLLLIWDNFETVHSMPDSAGATAPLDDAGCREVQDFLASLAQNGKSAVLITSRTAEDWLGPIRRIKVGGLATEEAARYAYELLAPYPSAMPRRAGRAFGELLDWLDGHPLSMRLILPCLDTTRPETLLDGLRGINPLPGTQNDLDGDRFTSLTASITYSFAHLAAKTRRLLPAICLFHGVAVADVLEFFSNVPGVPSRFAGASAQEWGQALDDATRVGLLTPLGAGMYKVHPALPAYLAVLWRTEDPDGHDSVRDAATRALTIAFAWFSDWLSQQVVGGNAGFAYSVIELQAPTLCTLLRYALEYQLWEQALAIVEVLYGYWDARGLEGEAAVWRDRALLATADPDGSPPQLDSPAGQLWLVTLSAQAERQRWAMHLTEAERSCRQILDMLTVQPSTPLQSAHIANQYHSLGAVAWARGELEDAEDWHRKSLAMFEALENRGGMAHNYAKLGNVAQRQGRLDDAEDWYRKSLTIFKELGDQPQIANNYHNLGVVAQLRGRLEDSEDWHRKSLAIKETIGDRSLIAASYHELGTVAWDREQLKNAEDWYRKSLAIYEALRDRSHMATTYHNLGIVAQLRGRLEDSEDWHRKSLAIDEELGNRFGVAISYYELGMVRQEQGRLEDAQDWHRKSLAIKEELGNPSSLARSYRALGLLAEQMGQPLQALEWVVRSVAPPGEFTHPLTGPEPEQLARLTAQLGTEALEATWQEVTGNPLPQPVRDYINSR